MRVVFAVLSAVSLAGCIESASNVSEDQAPAVKGSVRVDLTSSSIMILVPAFAGDRLSRVSAVGGSSVMNGSMPVSTTPTEVGTVSLGTATYQINAGTPCTQNLQSGVPSCAFPSVASETDKASATTSAAVSPGPPTGISQIATPMSGMICAGHGSYPTKIWQKQFTVALVGPPDELDKITEVTYTVLKAYERTYSGASRVNNFDAGASFLTPLTSVSLDPATILSKTGENLSIAGVTLSWSDSDPAKKVAENCEPTAD